MADGLRLLGSCPRCGGALAFREAVSAADRLDTILAPSVAPAATAPHLVLGIPRR